MLLGHAKWSPSASKPLPLLSPFDELFGASAWNTNPEEGHRGGLQTGREAQTNENSEEELGEDGNNAGKAWKPFFKNLCNFQTFKVRVHLIN